MNSQQAKYNTLNPPPPLNSHTVGAGSLAALSDVNLVSLQDGDLLQFDAASSKWLNGGVIDLGGPF